jgi:ATP-binding cassette subfamily C protein
LNIGLKILSDVYAHSGIRLWMLLALLIVTGVSDGISMTLLYPVIQRVGLTGSSTAGSESVRQIFEEFFNWLHVEPTLTSASLILLASFFIQGLLFTAQNWLLLDTQKKYIAAWQHRLFDDFVAAEWPYFASQKLGGMANLVMIECTRVGAAFFAIMQLVAVGVIFSIYMIIALALSWRLMLYLIVAGLFLLALVHPVRRATRRYGSELGAINADLASTLNELLGGGKLIKASAGETKAKVLMAKQIDQMRHNLTWGAFVPTTVRSVFEFGAVLTILGAMFYGLQVEQIGAAQLLILIALVARLLPRLMQMQIFHNALNLTAPSYEILFKTHQRFAAHREGASSAATGTIDPQHILPATVSVRNVTLSYGDHKVLDRVSFEVAPGQIVGVVGPSGGGKTTLIDSVLGLVVPAEGDITVGDVPLRDLDLRAWRRKVGYVSQETFLFHDTIANNIRWTSSNTSMEQVEAAARAAGLQPLLETLPAGYDTIVGDRGAKLSGGQRQRISLARVLIRQPSLLVLDEATSALDSLSEQEIMGVINSLRGKMSIIIVAHRFATVRDADFIFVLDQGRIVEQGTWESLSGGKALFHQLMQAQAVGARPE